MSDDLHARVQRLAEQESGPAFWRGLDEILGRAEEIGPLPDGVNPPQEIISRRSFLGILGASVALAGLDGCTRMPPEKILPYVREPPELTPGIPLHFATSMVLDGYATGLVVESHVGRPTKIEGNPIHPASLGAAGVFEQASLLELYNPNRARRLRRGRSASTWGAFAAELAPARLGSRVGARGTGLHLLLEPTSSPLEGDLLQRLMTLYPDAGVHFYSPLASDAASLAAPDGSGRVMIPQYDMGAADVILTVQADPLSSGPFHLRYARQFADGRRLTGATYNMNRLYAAESAFSVTGAAADHRFPIRPSDVEPLLQQLLEQVSAPGVGTESGTSPGRAEWVNVVARDLRAHAGRSLVMVGDRQAPRAHALAHAINVALGNIGRTIWFTSSPLLGAGNPRQGLPALLDALRGGTVDTLVVIGGNPAYNTPAEMEFARLLRGVRQSVYAGLYENETARDSTWMVPMAHYLESWGDARAYDGTVSMVQPLVQPLYEGRTTASVLAALYGDGAADPYTLLRQSWQRRRPASAADFDTFWNNAVQRGLVEGTAFPHEQITPHRDLLGNTRAGAATQTPEMEIIFLGDPRVYDGRFADNPWLQEFPEPLTTLTWDNAAHVSPATAHRLGAATGDVLSVTVGGRSLQIPALVVPGHADETVSLHLGYGRTGAEAVARGVGVDCYSIWPADMAWSVAGGRVQRAPDASAYPLALTQTHWTLEGRHPVRTTTLEKFRTDPGSIGTPPGRALSLYQAPPHAPPGDQREQQWAMAIDLTTCTGCGGCIVACQAENNVPSVGKEGVLHRREMHWLRIDRYFSGAVDNPAVVNQPMLCQHCERAPCEYVCPVEATVHSPDGLNEMVYNRCVGTRFCSNNCPYKVRRFNWFDYNRELTETEALARNPDVTVRERGVMEKCTFCVQRIRESEIAARVDGRSLRGDEVRTACQQACPTNAIVFGSLTDPTAQVTRLHSAPRAYSVLEELGTNPRIRYLARVRNVNPELPNPELANPELRSRA